MESDRPMRRIVLRRRWPLFVRELPGEELVEGQEAETHLTCVRSRDVLVELLLVEPDELVQRLVRYPHASENM